MEESRRLLIAPGICMNKHDIVHTHTKEQGRAPGVTVNLTVNISQYSPSTSTVTLHCTIGMAYLGLGGGQLLL